MKTTIFFIIQVLYIFSVYSQINLEWNINDNKKIDVNALPLTIKLIGFKNGDTISFIDTNSTTVKIQHENLQQQAIIIKNEKDSYSIEYDSVTYSFNVSKDEGKIHYNFGTKTNTLILGFKKENTNKGKQGGSKNEIIKLPDIDCRYGDSKKNIEKYEDKIGRGNKLLVIDASPFVSAQSGIYHPSKKGKKGLSECNYLSYGDFVKVYIENLNPYLHDVKVATASIDIGIKPVESDVQSSSLQSGEVGFQPSDSLVILLNYSNATKYLLEFIKCVKTNGNPSSDVLESNKDTIRKALNSANIKPDVNIQEIYTGLADSLKVKYESEYELGKQFSSVFNEFESLSYTLESTLLPIRVKSYDKLSITITLRDIKSKSIVQEQEYEFLIRGGWNIDQSFGIVGHQLTDKIYTLSDSMGIDPIYYTLPNGFVTDSISSYTSTVFRKIDELESPSAAFGLSTLTNIYYRVTPGINVGFGLGVSADFYPNTNVRYLTGGTLIFKDDRNKISLNIGCAWGQYKDIGTGHKNGAILKGANTIPNMIDKYGSSLYIGISYQNQIFKLNNIQAEKKEVN